MIDVTRGGVGPRMTLNRSVAYCCRSVRCNARSVGYDANRSSKKVTPSWYHPDYLAILGPTNTLGLFPSTSLLMLAYPISLYATSNCFRSAI